MVDIPDDPNLAYYAAIGVIAVQWAYIEFSIDICIFVIHHAFDGKIINKRIPKTRFTEKIKYLTKTFNESSFLVQYKEEGLKLINIAKKYSDDRHRIIHGSIIKFSPDILHYTKFIYGIDDIHDFDIYNYKLTDMIACGKNFQDLANRLASFQKRLIMSAGMVAMKEFDQL